MYSLVDWISFTVDAPQDLKQHAAYFDPLNRQLMRREACGRVRSKIGPVAYSALFGDIEGGDTLGRFPYRFAARDNTTRAMLFFSPEIPHILVELSGHACAALAKAEITDDVLASVADRMTRIDVSADIATETTPVAFVGAGYSPKFGSIATMRSESGETVYIGSMKSDRYAVVYRYGEPHPRHELLRIEHRFRRQRAVDMAKYVVQYGLQTALHACGEVWQWQHGDWQPKVITSHPLGTIATDARESNVARWLVKQVFPAMRRYERDGVIPDLKAFLQLYLFDDQATEE